MNTPDPFFLEGQMVDYDWGLEHAPQRLTKIVKSATAEGISTGFAFYENVWYVLMCGQGPMIADMEEIKYIKE